MLRNKSTRALLTLGLALPIGAYAANFCVAVDGGFPGGTSYIGPGFALPADNACAPWVGFTKTATTVITIATGTGCMSSNGKVLTLSIFNTDPSFFGAGSSQSDYVVLCPTGTTACPITASDTGYFGGGTVKEENCTASLLKLPPTHD